MLPFSDRVKDQAMLDIEHRAAVGPQQLPTCCFFTLFNTKQTLCSMDFHNDASHVAAGFSDSSVRIYNMKVSHWHGAALQCILIDLWQYLGCENLVLQLWIQRNCQDAQSWLQFKVHTQLAAVYKLG